MIREIIDINGIPALIWGEPSDKVYIFVHGKKSLRYKADLYVVKNGESEEQLREFNEWIENNI